MAKTDWYFVGFIVTAVAAGAFWGLAIIVYRNNRREYLNRTLALAMTFMGFWMLSGFVEKTFANPSSVLTLWTFRWAYAAGIMTSVFAMLFIMGLYLNRAPRKRALYSLVFMGIAGAVLSLSPFVIKSAGYHGGVLKSQNGLLFPLAGALILFPALIGLVLLFRKWRTSTGIDRARTSVVFGATIIFVPIVAVSTFILPAIFDNDVSTNFAYIAGVIPVALISYSIVRLRLLDVRIILRKSGVFIFGMLILVAPLAALLAIFQATSVNVYIEDAALLTVFVVLVFFAPRVWRYVQELSSKLFFSELYDELHLLDTVSTRLVSPPNLESGLLSALSEIVYPLGVESVGVVVPPGVINDNCWYFECRTQNDGNRRLREKADEDYVFPPWLNNVNNTVVTEELMRWPRSKEEKATGAQMSTFKLSACVPIKILSAKAGYIVLGEKASKRAVSSTDISFLEKLGERLGLFVDNYSLSAKLGTQLKELQSVYADLHEAYKFKSEVIQVTSHEFRTPITLVSGFALTLKEGWNQIVDEDKLSFLDDIVEACGRITDLTDQFFSVSSFEEGKISVEKMPVKLNGVIQRLCSTLLPEEQERIIIEADPDMYIFSDPEHLHAVLKNVLENALRFSPADQPVIIRVWRNSIHDYIQIKDFGNGIPGDDIERIFEPFVRLESLTHHSKGMGLGLYIVRLLASKLGIEVEIDCSDGNGTAVTLSIPL